MSEQFDPYHKWLGISPKDQPPNHYRLLGIDRFEADPDVISNAADQRMAHVKTTAGGEHVDASQKILTEIAAAKVCLLNPDAKAEYDDELRDVLDLAQILETSDDRETPKPEASHRDQSAGETEEETLLRHAKPLADKKKSAAGKAKRADPASKKKAAKRARARGAAGQICPTDEKVSDYLTGQRKKSSWQIPALVAAGTVVNRDVPDGKVIAGASSRIVCDAKKLDFLL